MGVCSSAESVREPPLFDLTMERLERRAAVYEIKYGADCEDCYDIIAQWLEEVDIDGSAPTTDLPEQKNGDGLVDDFTSFEPQKRISDILGEIGTLHGSATSIASSDHDDDEQTGSRDGVTRFETSAW